MLEQVLADTRVRFALMVAMSAVPLGLMLLPLARKAEEVAVVPYTPPYVAPVVVAPAPPAPVALCPGKMWEQTVGREWTVINANFCQIRGVVMRGCLRWYDSQRVLLARSCEGDMPSVARGIYAVEAENTAVLRLNHCPPFTPGNLLEACR